ncbi:hypothetical protein SeLEV6574_g00124 [Synchytrium endobioticum]|uniref:Uncharacterized protein n=1 Tax=Synchytrium endobioticum TaxID=286115 RepID=A0A507DJP4_9FUNG|nr:hypothetical protein SeLEV6574_g00124 [Synchytrium endobioticum]
MPSTWVAPLEELRVVAALRTWERGPRANRLARVLEDAGCFEAHHCQSLYTVRVGSTTTLNFSRGFLVVSLFLTGVTADHIREDP